MKGSEREKTVGMKRLSTQNLCVSHPKDEINVVRK